MNGGSKGAIVYGDAIGSVAFSVSYSGFADGEDESSLEGHDAIVYLTRDSGDNAYEPGAAAGSVYKVTTESLSSDNYNIRVQAATLTVERRAVTVTIHDQTTTYTGVTAALTQGEFTVDDLYEGDNEADLCVTLATTGVNAGTHDITATYDKEGNYAVTFEGNGSQEGDNTWGKLTIGQATLTVTVQDASITYGDALDADALFTVKYSGFVNNEGNENGSTLSDLKGTVVYTTENKVGGAAYAQGDAAGSEYTISASGLTSSNYTIVFEEGTLTVEKRVVTVSVTPGSEQYHYGDPIAAIVEFTNEYVEAQLAEGTDYTVQYKGQPFGTSGWSGDVNNFTENVPVDAGEYVAQVVLSNTNYTFENEGVQTSVSAAFEYNIDRRVLDVDWDNQVIGVVDGTDSYTNVLRVTGLKDGAQFDTTVLSLGNVQTMGSGAGTVSEQPAAGNSYTVTVTGVNVYSVTVTIAAEHAHNYAFAEGNASSIAFEVSADVNEIAIKEGVSFDWTYGTPALWTSDPSVLGDYFELLLGEPEDIIIYYAQGDSEDGTGLAYSSSRPTNAGSYWLRAYYPGSANAGRTDFVYAQFTISPKKVAPPVLDTAESTYNVDIYNGTPLTNNVNGYVSGTMTVSSTATIATSTEGGFTVSVQTSNAGVYTVTIALTSDNFVWADGTAEAVVLTWTVRAAEDNAVAIPDAEGGNSWTYGDAPSTLPQATATYGTAVYAYALLPEGFTGEDYSAVTGWTGGFPTDAGKYVVRATVAETNNYNGAVAYKQFTIEAAGIAVSSVTGYAGTYDGRQHNARTAGTAEAVDGSAVTWQYRLDGQNDWQTAQIALKDAGEYTVWYKVSAKNHADATGSFRVRIDKATLGVVIGSAEIVYGEQAPESYSIEYRGFVLGETQTVITGTPKFTAEGYDGAAGEYDVTVSGIEAKNYDFDIVKGTLIVRKKTVNVTIGSASSVYGSEVSADEATWSADDEAFAAAYGDYIALSTTADATSDVGSYPVEGAIVGSPEGIGNYEIVFKNGAYTITAKPVTVTITPNGGVYNGTVTPAEAAFAAGDIVSGDVVTITLTYTDSASYNSTDVPTDAGTYIVTATLAGADAGNYSLDPTSAVFTIGRAEVEIPAAQSKPYTGEPLTADLATNDIYSVKQGSGWINVDTYGVELTIIDPNYKWKGAEGDTVTVGFTIEQAENKFTKQPVVTSWTYGKYDDAVNAPAGAAADFGDVVYEYAVRTGDDASAVTEWFTWGDMTELAAGDYWLIAVVTEDRNWKGAQSEAFAFTVSRAQLPLPSLTVSETTYTGDELSNVIADFDGAKMEVSVTEGARAENGVVYATAGGVYTVTVTLTDLNYVWQDEDGVIELTWTVTAAENAIEEIVFDDEWTYFGARDPETPSATAAFGEPVFAYAVLPVDFAGDYSTLAWTDAMPSDVGSYVLRASVAATDSWNAAEGYFTFTILPAEIALSGVKGYTGTYDAEEHNARTAGSAAAVDGSAVTWQYALTNDEDTVWSTEQIAFTDAGTYTVYCKLSAVNHADAFVELTVVIRKAQLVVRVGTATIDYGEEAPSAFGVTYAGFVGGEDESVLTGSLTFTVVGYTAGSAAGSYTVRASGLEAENYEIDYRTGTLFVRSVDLTVTIAAGGGVYGGTITPATATLHGAYEDDEVGVILTYTGTANDGTSYNSTAVPTKAGTYIVTATLTTDSYRLIGTTSAAFVIERQMVRVPSPGSKPYTGKPQQSNLTETDLYTVEQGDDWVDVGSYTVTLTLKDTANYRWDNANAAVASVTFRITSAENAFIKSPVIEDWMYGDEPNVPSGAQALYGNAFIVYKYSAEKDGEYSSVVPEDAGSYYVRAYVEAAGNYGGAVSEAVAFRILPRPVALPSLETGSSVYSGGSLTNAIVGYDPLMMAVAEGAVAVVDGKTVLSEVNAGVYTVKIALTSDNYVWEDGSEAATLTWTIAKLAIEKPAADKDAFIADGGLLEYVPEGFDDETMEIEGNIRLDAGTYTVYVTLRDPANYCWSDGTTDAVTFTWLIEEEVLSLLWLIILLAVIAAIELVILIVGIIRRKKRDGDGGDGGTGGTKAASVAALPMFLAVFSPAEVTVCWILGAVVVILLVAILLVFLLKKKGTEDAAEEAAADAAEPAEPEEPAEPAEPAEPEEPEESAAPEEPEESAAPEEPEEPAAPEEPAEPEEPEEPAAPEEPAEPEDRSGQTE